MPSVALGGSSPPPIVLVEPLSELAAVSTPHTWGSPWLNDQGGVGQPEPWTYLDAAAADALADTVQMGSQWEVSAPDTRSLSMDLQPSTGNETPIVRFHDMQTLPGLR